MNVPFPFRIAVGVLAVGFDRLRALPEDLPALTVSLAGHAVRASMRVQQEIAHLAARGEEVLSPLTDRPEEHPAWAHFDDEDDAADAVDAVDADHPDAGSEDGSGADSGAPIASVKGQAEVPDYDDLRIAQLRARLRNLNRDVVAALLEYERGGQARAPYLTTLENRLTTLQSDAGRRTNHRSAS